MTQNTTPAISHNSCNNNYIFLALRSDVFFSCNQYPIQWQILLSPASKFIWNPNTCHLPHCYYDYSIISCLDYFSSIYLLGQLSPLPSLSLFSTHVVRMLLSDHVTSLTQTHPVSPHLNQKKGQRICKDLQSHMSF